MIADKKDHAQYLSCYLDDCTCSLTEQTIALNALYYGPKMLFKNMKIYSIS